MIAEHKCWHHRVSIVKTRRMIYVRRYDIRCLGKVKIHVDVRSSALDCDEQSLTEYQCLLRKQIELFEAGPADIRGTAQGRNTPITMGQVGIRCRHCAPITKAARARGAVFYSKTIDGIYQVAQNMSKVHLCERCHRVPDEVKHRLQKLRTANSRASGGKEYWSEGIRALGVYNDGEMLRFAKRPPPPSGDIKVKAGRQKRTLR